MRKQKEMTAQTVRKVNMKDWNLKMRMKTLNHLKMCEFCCLKILACEYLSFVCHRHSTCCVFKLKHCYKLIQD